MNWTDEAKRVFQTNKPEHFTNYQHCCECAEHDETLGSHDIDSIGINELGNPGWDPICFCNAEGFLYYMPALIRLTLDSMEKPEEFYLDQLLFHLIGDGKDNRRVSACNAEQRQFVARFLEYLTENYMTRIEAGLCHADDILKAHDIWDVEPRRS